VPFADTQRMFSLASEPKQLKSISGTEHALHLFEGEHAEELTHLLLSFITSNAPATP
jgi:hypothetical protein